MAMNTNSWSLNLGSLEMLAFALLCCCYECITGREVFSFKDMKIEVTEDDGM